MRARPLLLCSIPAAGGSPGSLNSSPRPCLQPRGLAGSCRCHPGSGRGWRRLGRRWPPAARSLGTAGSEGAGDAGGSARLCGAPRGPAGAGGRGGSLLRKLRVSRGDRVAFIQGFTILRRFLVVRSVCKPKAGVGSCRGSRCLSPPVSEGVWVWSGKFSGSCFTTCMSQLQELSRGAQPLGSAPSQLSLSLSLMLRSTLLPGMCTVIVAGYFPTPTSSFRHSLNYLKMTGAYRGGFLLLCYFVGNPKLRWSCVSLGSHNTLIFSLQLMLMLRNKQL